MSFVTSLTHTFTPQVSNKHKARVLHPELLVVFLLLFVFIQKSVLPVTHVSEGVLGYASQISIGEVISLTNAKRAEAGLPTLVENSDLNRAAKAKGEDMLAKGYWAHVAPDGTQPWDFFKAVGYKYRYAGENLARDFSSPSSAVEAWMTSPSHKENLLSSRYKEIGVAAVDGLLNGKDTTIIVQLFGSTVATSQIPTTAAADDTKKPAPAVATAKPTLRPTAQPAVTEPVVAEAVPVPTAVPTEEPSSVLSSPEKSVSAITSPEAPNYARMFSLAVIAFLFVALVIDAVVMWGKGISRKGGKPLAQIAFMGMILALLVVARAGQII